MKIKKADFLLAVEKINKHCDCEYLDVEVDGKICHLGFFDKAKQWARIELWYSDANVTPKYHCTTALNKK
ncbi:MAG: hypothetical protein KAS32_30735 [Candidatus Peribacteraceae bacterium]|nr:hypothetical protein [Candidatus Peribacteraceae bacterium]